MSGHTGPAGRPDAATRSWTPRTVGLCVLLFATLFVAGRLLVHDGDPSAFVSAGDELTDPTQVPELTVKVDSVGYDGQYFHRLARNPFTSEPREFGTIFDRAAYRQQRIGYPLAAWTLAGGGRAGLVPWTLIGVNLAAMGAIGYLAARLAEVSGRPAWWGFIPAAWPGFVVALSYDLSEVMAAALLLGALLALRRERWIPGVALLTAAGLTRETTLVIAVAVVGAVVLRRLPLRGWLRSFSAHTPGVPLFVGLAPLAVTGAYRLALTARWDGVYDIGPAPPSFIRVPLVSLIGQLADWLTAGDRAGYVHLFLVALLLFVVSTLAGTVRDTDAGRPHERLALVGFLLIMSMLPTWDRSVVFLRWADEVVVLGWLLSLDVEDFDPGPVARVVGALALVTAIIWVRI